MVMFTKSYTENWSAFAPDFEPIDYNIDYEEKEDEFDEPSRVRWNQLPQIKTMILSTCVAMMTGKMGTTASILTLNHLLADTASIFSKTFILFLDTHDIIKWKCLIFA